MSAFAFGNVQLFTDWQANQVTPLPRFLTQNVAAGWDYSLGSSLADIAELSVQEGPLLTSEELAELYKDEPYIQWPDRPLTRHSAEIIANRHRYEQIRNQDIEAGMTGIGRMGAAFAAQMAGTIANPVDLGLMFLPVIGSSAKARALAEGTAGFGKVSALAARGLVTEETLAQAGIRSRLGIRALESGLSAALTEPIVMASRNQAGLDYSFDDYLKAIAFSSAAGAGFHLLGVTTKRVYELMSPEVRETAGIVALDQALRSEPISVDAIAHTDPNLVAREILARESPAWMRDARAQLMEADLRLAQEQMKLAELQASEKAGKEIQFDQEKAIKKAIADIEKQKKEIEQNVLWGVLLDKKDAAEKDLAARTVAPGALLPTPKGESKVRVVTPWLDGYRVEFENGFVTTVPERMVKGREPGVTTPRKADIKAEVDREIRKRVSEQLNAAKKKFEAEKPEAVKTRVEQEVREALKKLGWSEEVAAKYTYKDHASVIAALQEAIDRRTAQLSPEPAVRETAKAAAPKAKTAGEAAPAIKLDVESMPAQLKGIAEEISKLDAEIKRVFDGDQPAFLDAMRKAAPCVLNNG